MARTICSIFSTPNWLSIVAVLLLIGIPLVLSQTFQQIPVDCLSGWENVGLNCYKLYKNRLPWITAERICANYGGHLATPFDFYENRDMATYVNDRGVTEFWIGAERMSIPPNNNRVLQYNGGLEAQMWIGYWGVYQPKFTDGNCVYVANEKAQLHKWRFGPCEMQLPFLCQRSICAQGSFHCTNGKCISPKNMCDGIDDCGDRSDEINCPNNCYYIIKVSSKGSIKYPERGDYPRYPDCSYVFEAEIGYNVQLTITAFVQKSINDQVILLDGGFTESSSDEIKRLSGSPAVPLYYQSSDNKIMLKIISEGNTTSFTGITFTYDVLDPNMNFPSALTATDTWKEFEYPYYKSYVLGSLDLYTVIEAQNMQQTVTLQILDQDLPGDASLVIRDGQTVFDRVLSELTGTYKGSGVFLSTGRYLYIALHTLRSSNQHGLKIRYMQGCGGTINQSTGYVSSPGYPVSNYPNGIKCNYAITVPGTKPVTILFTNLDIHLSDTIKLIENTNVIGVYSGNNVLSPVRINSGQFNIEFITSSTLNSRGFNFTFSIDCPKPAIDLSQSVISGTYSESFGSSFTVSCKQGSQFSQAEHMNKLSIVMTCGAYGQWNVNTSPNCEAIRCPKAPGLINGYIVKSSGNLTFGGTITYNCYQGFNLVGSDTVTCNSNGQWVIMPSCQASICGNPPPSDPNGSQNITLGDGSQFGSIRRYYCNDGYDLIGHTTMFCESNGTWIGTPSSCKILTCYMNNISNGVLSSNKANVGQTVMLTCNPGYRSVTGETTMICNSNRSFTPMLFCQNINECLDNATCQHRCVDTEGSYRCECNSGFQVDASLCKDIDECNPNPCNGTCNNTIGSYQCSCTDGYSLYVANGTQGFYIPNGEDGTLAGDVYRLNHSCVPNMCAAPPLINNAVLLSSKTTYYYNDAVMYKCQLGFKLENALSGMLRCDQTGNWTGPNITCLGAMCAVDQEPKNLINPGSVSAHNMNIMFGDQINITCNVPGFTPQTFMRIRKCTLIGGDYRLDGSVNDYECGFISCGKPMDEPGSSYTGLSTFYYNSSFTFGCLLTSKLNGASELRNNNTVTCQENGQWDFGNLQCIGIQCLDPGQPYLGKQVYSDYREGQFVNFTCVLPGYTINPPGVISCSLQSGTALFNSSVPNCVDSQPPTFENCPQSEISILRNTSAGFMIPEPIIKDNGGIKRLTVSPAWPHSKYYVTSETTFTYNAIDYNNNQATCSIKLKKKDDVSPNITCPDPIINIFRTGNDAILVNFTRDLFTVKDDVTPLDQLQITFPTNNYLFTPNNAHTEYFPPALYKTITATVQDAAGNSGFCNFGLFFQPDSCSPYSLRKPPNSNKSCNQVGDGYLCTITCDPGFSLYNEVKTKSMPKSCSGKNSPFTPDTDIKCVNLTSLDGSYKLEYNYVYEGQNVTNSCMASYEKTISSTLKNITDDKKLITQSFCENSPVSVQGRISLGNLTINEAEKRVYVRYIINFDRRSGSRYSDCADGVLLFMNKPESYITLLLKFVPLECDMISLSTDRSLLYDGYYCEDSKRQLIHPNGIRNLSYCLSCPEGTYYNNSQCVQCPRKTFSDRPNMGMCTACPIDTSTYSTGAVSSSECAPECVSGTTSLTGLPPCYACQQNMYWANATTCVPCPPNTLTRGRGSKSQDDCRVQCGPGSYNEVDGYAECKLCPLHTYNSRTGALSCDRCNKDQFTNSVGKTSINDCLGLSTITCPCVHGTCSNILENVLSCVCEDGWTGETCSKSFNPCDSHPCDNGGRCTAIDLNYTCQCPTGTSGNMCQEIIKTCTPDYCQNNGMCENLANGALCHCLTGYTGDRCQTTEDICRSQPCQNGGICKSLENIRFSCSCQTGFTGKTCEISIDDCYASPCKNNGTCKDEYAMYTCDCNMAYSGLNCQEKIQPCTNINCGQGAKCVEDEINSTYMCICNEYSQPDNGGMMTCMTRDFCSGNPCLNNGTCTSGATSFMCMCPLGFAGSRCQHNINDCLRQPCLNGGKCKDLVAGFQCDCNGTGFEGNICSVQVDNCAYKPCTANGTNTCQNLVNAYNCLCKPGYTGKTCEIDINECDSQPCYRNANCVNMENDYMCQCPAGWRGKNCQEEIPTCTSTTCLNMATCYDYFNGYFCKCRPNTYEKNCSASVNVCQVANPCVHGKCEDKNGNAECSCDIGYEGSQCEMQQNFCSQSKSVCMNSGQCIPQLDKFECKCPPGYTGDDCSTLISLCGSKNCPVSSTCYQTDDKAFCRCPLDKDETNCDKVWDQNFDLLFDHEQRIGMGYVPYSIKLSSPSFSISLWLQFGKIGGSGTFLSLLSVPSPTSLKNKLLHLWIDEKAIYYSSNGTTVNLTHNINYYNNGLWHYLVVNVNRTAGVMYFIVDTINSPPINIPANDIFYENIWLALGVMYDPVSDMPVKGRGFYGKLSKVTVYSHELELRNEVTIQGNINSNSLFPNDILRWSSEWKYSVGVIRMSPSMADKRTCPFGYTDAPNCATLLPGKKMVKIASGQCSGDIIKLSQDRLTEVSWLTPTFSGQDSSPVSSYTTGDTFVWGKYSVVTKASNSDGNSALCLFNIFIQNDNCTNPQKPPNAQELICFPPSYEKYKQCSMTCMNSTAPSFASPRIHTCGPVGNWDPLNKFVPYRITPCGAISRTSRQLVINLGYSVVTTECLAVTKTLEEQLRITQVNLNNEWNQVCSQSNCADTQINVTCLNTRPKRQATGNRLDVNVVLVLNDTGETVINRKNNSEVKTEDLYKEAISKASPNNVFDYSKLISDATPTLNSITTMQMCNPPKVFLENNCVDCGPGTFYNSTEYECQFCPIGSYQPLSAQTSCTVCPQGKTTATTGSYSDNECYDECPIGQYMNMMSSPPMCTNCSRGSYQPKTGQFSCLVCPSDKTTKYTGSTSTRDCSNDCPSGQEIGSTNNCTDCRIGFYRGRNDPVCQKCPDGLVTNATAQFTLADCNVADNPPGTKRRQDDQTKYEACPIGTYQNNRWQYDCISCGVNHTTENVNSTSIDDCKYFCPAGYQIMSKPNEKLSNESCVPCQLAFYRNGSKPFDSCEPCPSMYTTLSTGAISQDNCTLYRCAKGEQPNSANTGCEPCPKGFYQESPDKPKCDPCSGNFSTMSIGSTRQDQCISVCPSGTEKFGGLCRKCPVGYFKDNNEDLFSNCTLCKDSMYVTPSEGSTSNSNCTVLNCSEGYIANRTALMCDPCPKGTYQDMKYQSSCIVCPQQKSTRQTGSKQLQDCEDYCMSGQEKPMPTSKCVDCQRGFYKDNSIDVFMNCTACDSRFVTPEGVLATSSKQCTVPNCREGSYINGDTCTLCPRGYYQDKLWQTNCTQCAVDRNTSRDGATKSEECLLSCRAGTANNGVNSTCDPCAIGYYKDTEGAIPCTQCANFSLNDIRISATTGSTNISNCTKLACLPGYYPLNEICTLCNYGSYQTERWQDSCNMCPSEKTTYKAGATDIKDCELNCNVGEGLVNDTCKKCEVGFYNDKSVPNRKDCFRCPGNTITLQEGATSASQCNIVDCSVLGQYRESMSNTCKNCPAGTYQDQVRQDSCKNCMSGYTTRYEKSASVADCKKDCQSGYHLDEATNMCVECAKGSYRNKAEGYWDCVNCTGNLTTNKAGSDKASDCSLSTCSLGFAYNTSTQTCDRCPKHTYSDVAGSFLPCKNCPTNKVTLQEGSSSITQCIYPCSTGDKCNIVTQVCKDIQSSFICECRTEYQSINGTCVHKCDIPDYCGQKGECIRATVECKCKDGYTGDLCDIRPAAALMSDQTTETIIIAVVTTLAALLFLILLVVSLCVMVRRRKNVKTPRTSLIDEGASTTTRSMKGFDDYPTFAVNPAFSSKPPSIFGGPNGALPSQGLQMYKNPTYNGDEDNDPAVYRA